MGAAGFSGLGETPGCPHVNPNHGEGALMAHDYTKIKMKFTMENLGDGDRSVTVEKKFNEEGRPYLDLRGRIERPSFVPLSRVDATVLARVLEAMAQGLP